MKQNFISRKAQQQFKKIKMLIKKSRYYKQWEKICGQSRKQDQDKGTNKLQSKWRAKDNVPTDE